MSIKPSKVLESIENVFFSLKFLKNTRLFIFSPSILFGLVFLKTFRSSHFLPKGDVQQNVKDNSDVDQCNGVKNVIDLLHDLFDEAHNRKETEKYGVRVYAQYTDHHPRFCNAPAVF